MTEQMAVVAGPGPAGLEPLDASGLAVQEAVLAGGPVAVAGAPGTGKTNLALTLTAQAVRCGQRAVLLSPSRQTASLIRSRLEKALGALEGQVVMTPVAFARWLLEIRADAIAACGLPNAAALASAERPQMVTGADQDAIIASLLRGQALGDVPAVVWPASLHPATLELAAFRAELRDLMMRAAERGLGPEELESLGQRHGWPQWQAAAKLYGAYLDVLGLGSASDSGLKLDAAAMVATAAGALENWDDPLEPLDGQPPGRLGENSRPRFDLVVVDDYQEAGSALAWLLRLLAQGGAQIVVLGCPDLAVQGYRGALPQLLASATDPSPDGFGAQLLVLETSHRQSGELLAMTGRLSQAVRPGRLGQAIRRVYGVQAPNRTGSSGQIAAKPPEATVCQAETDLTNQPEATVNLAETDLTNQPEATVNLAETDLPNQPEATANLGCAQRSVLIVESLPGAGAAIARLLRRRHLLEAVPWRQMAVLTRTASQVEQVRTALTVAGVPVFVPGSQVLSLDQPAVQGLFNALECALAGDQLRPAQVSQLLTGPIGQLNRLELRRLRRCLLQAAVAADPQTTTSSEQLLVEVLISGDLNQSVPADLAPAVSRVSQVLAAGRQAAASQVGAGPLLWALWQASGLAESWSGLALEGGSVGQRADGNLDAICALFAAAERFDSTVAGGGAAAFIRSLQAQQVPTDTVAAHAPAADRVTVATATAAVGREWDTVVICGLQTGQWPDTRLRDSLLGAGQLADLLDGKGLDQDYSERRRAIVDDEARLAVLAVSRARAHLAVVVEVNEETRPSPLAHMLLPPHLAQGLEDRWARQPQTLPWDLRGLVAKARANLLGAQEPALKDQAAAVLAVLANLQVPGANPDHWPGLLARSSSSALFGPKQAVRLSPSKVESLETCPLRWAMERAGGAPFGSNEATLGTIIHELAHEFPTAGAALLLAELDKRWQQLGLADNYDSAFLLRRARMAAEKLGNYQSERQPPIATEAQASCNIQLDTTDLTNAEAPERRIQLTGRIDRLEAGENSRSVKVVDYKTGQTAISKARGQTNPQLAAYQLLVNAGTVEGLESGQ
ncbi:MAG: PD-(D/E)XK nuclease family protein, partial [Micrococcales bacterium]|nr:PD-(D/E)XK nuclease family protein [Micrococcales bacterium]